MTLKLHASYLSEALFQPAALIKVARADLKGVKFDTLIGTGLSGALMLPMMARAMRKKFAVVRKADGSHSCQTIEGEIGSRWLFLDDLICSGDTLARVFDEITRAARAANHGTEFVGAYLYQGRLGNWREPSRGFRSIDSLSAELTCIRKRLRPDAL